MQIGQILLIFSGIPGDTDKTGEHSRDLLVHYCSGTELPSPISIKNVGTVTDCYRSSTSGLVILQIETSDLERKQFYEVIGVNAKTNSLAIHPIDEPAVFMMREIVKARRIENGSFAKRTKEAVEEEEEEEDGDAL